MKEIENITGKKVSSVDIPPRIITYMKKYFEEKDLSGIRMLKNKDQLYYKLEVTTEHNIYRLKFSSKGLLVEKVMEPLFDGILDETGVGD